VSVIDGPEGFFKPNELAPRAYLGNPIFHSQDKSCYADTCRPGEVEDDDPSFRPRVDFRLSFVRDPSYVFLTYVLVGWAFNMIAFSAFWFPRGSSVDRAGLSIGGIITAQFMLYDAKVTVKWVWLDTYLMVMLLFQFLCFALIMLSAHYDRHIPRGLGSFVTRSQKTPEGFGHSVPTTVKVIINNICPTLCDALFLPPASAESPRRGRGAAATRLWRHGDPPPRNLRRGAAATRRRRSLHLRWQRYGPHRPARAQLPRPDLLRRANHAKLPAAQRRRVHPRPAADRIQFSTILVELCTPPRLRARIPPRRGHGIQDGAAARRPASLWEHAGRRPKGILSPLMLSPCMIAMTNFAR